MSQLWLLPTLRRAKSTAHATYTCPMRLTLLLVLPCLLMSSCGPSSGASQFELGGATMGTTFEVKIVAPPDSASAPDLQEELQQALDAIENLASTYIEQSELSMFNSNASTDWISVSPQLCYTVARALELARRTDGAFDITVGPLVNLWGFGPNGVRSQPPSDADIARLMMQIGFAKLQADCERPALRKQHSQLFVDLSGWAKGFAADQLAEIL